MLLLSRPNGNKKTRRESKLDGGLKFIFES